MDLSFVIVSFVFRQHHRCSMEDPRDSGLCDNVDHNYCDIADIHLLL